MNVELILRLVGLRYKLLWAQTRTRNGRIALFVAGYTIAILIVILVSAGGYGAAMMAVRSGKAEVVAQAVLGGLFLNALFVSVVTGFGINSSFTDAALRRFPINATGRLAARHLTGILEPVWIFALALFVGLSTGLYVFGSSDFLLGLAAALLLLMVDYLMARTLATAIEWLSHVRGGNTVLFLMLMSVCLVPGVVIPRLEKSHAPRQAILSVLHYSPPFAGAALMMKPESARLLYGFGVLAAWIGGLAVLLVILEKLAARPRGSAAAAVRWDDRFERVASIFGPALAPLVGRCLRYYVRSNKVRFNYISIIPALAFVTFTNAPHHEPLHFFVRALGAFTVVGFVGTAVMSTNQFGFDSSGFRRYFLLPVPPGMILRASSFTALFLGSTLVAMAFVLWMALAPVPFDGRMPAMILGCGVGGLFLFNALAIWTSLLSPRRTDFESTFGNQLSLGANVLLIGGMLGCVFTVFYLDSVVGPATILRYWWGPGAFAVVAIAFYVFSLRRGAEVFVSHKERLLNTIEGRN